MAHEHLQARETCSHARTVCKCIKLSCLQSSALKCDAYSACAPPLMHTERYNRANAPGNRKAQQRPCSLERHNDTITAELALCPFRCNATYYTGMCQLLSLVHSQTYLQAPPQSCLHGMLLLSSICVGSATLYYKLYNHWLKLFTSLCFVVCLLEDMHYNGSFYRLHVIR